MTDVSLGPDHDPRPGSGFNINESLAAIGELTGRGLSRPAFTEAVLEEMCRMGFDRARFWEVVHDVSREVDVVVLASQHSHLQGQPQLGCTRDLDESDVAKNGQGLNPIVTSWNPDRTATELERVLDLGGRHRVEIPVTAGTRTESILACDWTHTATLTDDDLRALRLVGSLIGSHLALQPSRIRRSVEQAHPKPNVDPTKLVTLSAKQLGEQLDAAVTAVFTFSWAHQRLTKIAQFVSEPYQPAADQQGEFNEAYVAGGPPLTGYAWNDDRLRHIVSFEDLVEHKNPLIGEESRLWHLAVLGEIRSVLYAVVGTLERRYLIRYINRATQPNMPFLRESNDLDAYARPLSTDVDAAISLQRLNGLQQISELTAASASPSTIAETIGGALMGEGVDAFAAVCHQQDSAQFSYFRAYGDCGDLDVDLHSRWADDALYRIAMSEGLGVASLSELAAEGASPIAAALAPRYKAVLTQVMEAGQTRGVFLIPLTALPPKRKGTRRELPTDVGVGMSALIHAYSRLLVNSVEMHQSQARLIGARRAFGLMGHEVRRPAEALGSAGRLAIVTSLNALKRLPNTDVRADLATELHASLEDLRAAERRLGSALRLAKIVARESEGRLKLRFRETDLTNVVKLARDDVEALAREEELPWNHFFSLNDAVNSLGTIVCDEDYLGQVLKNIFLNAVKYSLPPTVTRRRSVRINIVGQPQRNWVGIQVQNWGWPIPPEKRDVIFEPWVRGDEESDSEALAGMGLGLYLARRLVAAHHGEIICTSVPTGDRFVPRPVAPIAAIPGLASQPSNRVVIHETTFEVRIPRNLEPGVRTHVWEAALGGSKQSQGGET